MTYITPSTTIGEVSIEFDDLGLEDPGRPQVLDVADVDLPGRVVAGLLVVAVGVQEVVAVAGGAAEEILGHRPHVAVEGRGRDLLGRGRSGSEHRDNGDAESAFRAVMVFLPRGCALGVRRSL